MASKYTIPGRAGFDYQDIVALDLVVEMMTHPDRYRWIQVESDDAGCLDDVTALKENGDFIYWQLKFAVDPEARGDSFNWKKLLEREKGENGPKDSLLMRWGKSLHRVMQQGPVAEAALITNRKASADLRAAFKNFDLVDLDKIQSSDTKKEIRKQVGSVKAARAFFSKFHFKMDQPGLDAWEESAKRKFELLGGTPEGWSSLKDNMRTWARERNQPAPDGLITLEKARQAALWKTLRRMPQEFEIPHDYVIPQDFHAAFMSRLRDNDRRCIVLAAPPGTGKSTYLSHVVRECRSRDIPVIRHHYFLSLDDRTTDRSFHRRVAESLMNDLMESYPESLGLLIHTNPNPDDLGHWLDQCGKHFSKKGQSLVVIVDGLDHVARDTESLEEVRDLLPHLLLPPEGVTIVLGTQPLEEPNVPKRLLDYAPRDSWEQLPRLDLSGVRVWVERNSGRLGLPEKTQTNKSTEVETLPSRHEIQQYQLEQERIEAEIDNLARAFWTLSDGHPLHLHYCLNYLHENRLPATSNTVIELPACSGGNIEQYYRDLFDSVIHEKGRQILHLMAACRFGWPERGIVETLDPDGASRADFVKALRSIKHLTRQTDLGLLPFHSSLLQYVENHKEHEFYRDISKQNAIGWLQSPAAPKYLRWSQEWMLLADSGDTGQLIDGPNRSWAINSLIKRYHPNEILLILSRSCRAALDKGLVAKYMKTALLRDYVNELYEGHETALETMLEAQLILLREEDYLVPRLRRSISIFSPEELVILARDAADRGDQLFVRDVFDHLDDRINMPRRSLSFDDLRLPFLRVAALCTDVDPIEVAGYINEHEDGVIFVQLAEVYSEELRLARRVEALRSLLASELDKGGKKIVARHASLLAMDQDIRSVVKLHSGGFRDAVSAVLAHLGHEIDSPSCCVDFPPLSYRGRHWYYGPDSNKSRREAIVREMSDAFFCLLAHHLAGQTDLNQSWLISIGDHSYDGRFLRKLDEVARDLAAQIERKMAPGMGFLFERLKGFEKPQLGPDAETWNLIRAVKRATVQIGLNITSIGKCMGIGPAISLHEIELAFDSEFCDWAAWIEIYLAQPHCRLSKDAMRWLLSRMESVLSDSIETFPDRALTLAQMAVLASTHGFEGQAAQYLEATAANLLGYGYHKDILLFEALDIVRECHAAGIKESRHWILELAAAVAHVRDFTDGDETRYLPDQLAEVLATMDPQLLLRYYQWLLSEEQYYTSDKTFAAFLSYGDLSSKYGQAAARTALDRESIAILQKRAAEGDQYSVDVLGATETYLGRLDLPLEEPRHENVHKPAWSPLEEGGPEPPKFPPDRFADYLTELWRYRRQILRHHLRVESWVYYWCESGKPIETFEALRTALKHGLEFSISDDLFDLAVKYLGSDVAFDWLVQAHGRNNGWRKYWGPREYAVQRWEIVKQRYPERWFEFLVESMRLEDEIARAPFGKEKIQRIVQYCIFMGQPEMAREIGEIVTRFVSELVSPLDLPRPGWVPEDD